MKENRLGPRKWAFVVVAGGTVIALPFMQRQPESRPQPPVVDAVAALLPETNLAALNQAAALNGQQVAPAAAANSAPNIPAWPTLPHSPFDELVQQKAVVPDAQPTEEIVPMHPLRPWISAPNLNNTTSFASASSTPSASATSATANESLTPLVKHSASTKLVDSAASASPWRDDVGESSTDEPAMKDPAFKDPAQSGQFAASFGQGRRQLSVAAGPADQYTVEEIAQKLNLPKQEDLASAIVPAEQVLPAPATATIPKPSVVLSRQPATRSVGAQVRFGQANMPPGGPSALPLDAPSMMPLPSLPPERRGHIIQQPTRPNTLRVN